MTAIEKINAQIEYTTRMGKRYLERAEDFARNSASYRDLVAQSEWCEAFVKGLQKALEYINEGDGNNESNT